MSFVNNIKDAFALSESSDKGSLVENILLIAGFAVVAILVVTWIGNAIAGSAANVSNCIAGANGANASDLNDTCTSDTVGVKSAVSATIDDQRGGRF